MNVDLAGHGWDWSPTTFEAIGTVCAALIAVLALVLTLRTERSRRAGEARAELLQQIQMVEIGVVADPAARETGSSWPSELIPHRLGRVTIRVSNFSSAPVYRPLLQLRTVVTVGKDQKPDDLYYAGGDGGRPHWYADEMRYRVGVLRFGYYKRTQFFVVPWPERIEPGKTVELDVGYVGSWVVGPAANNVGLRVLDWRGSEWTLYGVRGRLWDGKYIGEYMDPLPERTGLFPWNPARFRSFWAREPWPFEPHDAAVVAAEDRGYF
ncbi:hypothetical protein [Cellulomonas sp. URHB0016]